MLHVQQQMRKSILFIHHHLLDRLFILIHVVLPQIRLSLPPNMQAFQLPQMPPLSMEKPI